MLIVLGEFYGPDASPANLELLSRFYQKYPEYADKTFLSVKVRPHRNRFRIRADPDIQGGTRPRELVPDGSWVSRLDTASYILLTSI